MSGKLYFLALLALAAAAPEWRHTREYVPPSEYDTIPVYDGPRLPNGCPEDWSVHWLLPHETDCSKFYYCNFGELVERDCAPETHFVPILQVCDHEWRAGCQTGAAPAPEPEPEVPEPEPEVPEPEPEVPEPEPEVPEPEPEVPEPEPEPEVPEPEPEVPAPAPEPQPEPEEAPETEWLPNGCPTNPLVDQLFPNEADCSTYFQCVHGEYLLRPCAPGTYFNFESQRCDATTCNGQAPAPAPEPEVPEPEPEVPEPEPEVPEPEPEVPEPEWLPNGCPTDSSINQLLPNEEDCSTFFQCVHGDLVLLNCAPGTFFNAESQNCDATTCNGQAPAPAPEPEVPEPEPEVPESEPEVPEPEPEVLPNGCPVDSTIDQLFPNEEDCSTYLQCVHGNLITRPCAPGTFFNPETLRCDSTTCNGQAPAPAPEPEVPEPEPEVPEPEPEVPEPEPEVPEPEPEVPEPEWLPNGCPTDSSINQLLPNEEDCSTFFQCVHGDLVLLNCAPGSYFNAETQNCDATTCNGEAPAPAPEPEVPEPEPEVPEPEPEVPEPEPEVPAPESPCAAGCNVLPWAAEDCDKFWQCDGSTAVLVTCSEGLHFNANTRTCDFICNANCDRDLEITASSGGLKVFYPWSQVDDEVYRLLKSHKH